MSTNVTMPSMGFDMTEGKVSRWLKNVGDPVTRNETIGEIETEKATVDLTAPVDGVFAQILVQPGETVPVNTPIAVIGAVGEAVGGGQAAAPAPQAQTQAPPAAEAAPQAQTQAQAPAPQAQAPAPPAQEAQIPADEKQKEGAPATATQPPATPSVANATPPSAAAATPTPAAAAAAPKETNGRIKASPLAKNKAKAEGVDLAALAGSGPNGRIIERDVLAAIQSRGGAQPTAAPSAPAPTPAAAAAPTQLVAGEQPLSKMRQVIARRLVESKTTIPHFYLTMEIFMDEAMKLRAQLNAMAAGDAEKLSVNDLIVAAAGRTLKKFPNVNGYFKGDRIELHDVINVGIAVSVDDGLLTPVLHNADSKPLKQIAVETKELAARARANKMRPDDLGPGTFTISNLGMYGIEEFAAIINPPESSILAVGAVQKVPVVLDDEIKIAQVMKVTMSVDHRIVDGTLGAKFLQELKKLLENPVNLLVS